MIFTLNEAIHLPACMKALEWCDDIIVIDSLSSDETEKIARAFGARFFSNAFAGFGAQRNWALDNTAPKYPWVLILDADERVPPELVDEMREVASRRETMAAAFRVRRRFYMWGRWLRYSSLYPTWVVRFVHRDRVRYENRGHAETQNVNGELHDLRNDLIDENLKGIDEWFERQNRYSRKEADYEMSLSSADSAAGSLLSRDPLRRRAALKLFARRMPFRGAIYFLYAFIFRLGFLDGRDGLMFCRMRAMYQAEIELKKFDFYRQQMNGSSTGRT
jgi:glycosyltransferase involved in cell wall biosynthesis